MNPTKPKTDSAASSPDPLESIDAVKAQSRVSPPSQAGASVTAEAYAISHAHLQPGIGKFRWRICALLFLATTINYMDRSVLGVLAPTLQYKVFNWSDQNYATINIAFKVAYAIGML